MRLGARWPQDAGRLRGMSLPPNGDEGDEGERAGEEARAL
jgi:hypothetical protein